MKLLLIGSLPPPYGGTTVSFKMLTDWLIRRDDVKITIINTIGIRDKSIKCISKLFGLVFNTIIKVRKSDLVSLHLNDTPLAYLGFFVIILSKIFNKPVIVRKFGGNPFNLGILGNWLACEVMKSADLCLLQTKMLLDYASKNGVNKTIWFPTSRPRPDVNIDCEQKSGKCTKFIFLGHIKREKGILELIESSERLPNHINVHVYGPFTLDLSESIFENKKRIKYCGIIEPVKVHKILCKYDVLVLPTYNRKEGYAGAIIEAYFSGLPIICTNWQALPEIVDSSSGILIPPKDPEALFKAMSILSEDSTLFNMLRKGSLLKAQMFDSEIWNDKFFQYCHSILRSYKTK